MNGLNDTTDKVITRITEGQEKDPSDYYKDGILYCGKCNTPKERLCTKGIFNGQRLPLLCRCEQERRERERRESADRERKIRIEELKRRGFLSRSMCGCTFANDNGRNTQMLKAKKYVSAWKEMQEKNIGLLIWGDVGSGKSYLAGCIANALMDQEIPVCMTNFAAIINDLSGNREDRNEYIDRLCSYPLLIIDDFGMERGTEYGLEQVYNVIDSRYRSRRPLIITTNLTLDEIRNAPDTAHARIYDRVLEMCVPILCRGVNFRKECAEQNYEYLKSLFDDSSHSPEK